MVEQSIKYECTRSASEKRLLGAERVMMRGRRIVTCERTRERERKKMRRRGWEREREKEGERKRRESDREGERVIEKEREQIGSGIGNLRSSQQAETQTVANSNLRENSIYFIFLPESPANTIKYTVFLSIFHIVYYSV